MDRATGIYLELEDFDAILDTLSKPPIYANDLSLDEANNKKQLSDLLLTQHDSDTLDSVPTCDCGHLRDGELIGQICPICGKPVMIPTERPIESSVWIRPPDGVIAMINPLAFYKFKKTFKKDGVSIFDWLVDARYKPKKQTKALTKLETAGVPRGLNEFIENFDQLMELLTSSTMFSSCKDKPELRRFKEWIDQNRHKLFPRAIPVPSKLAFIVETLEVGRYADKNMNTALDAVLTMMSLNSGISPPNHRKKEERTVKTCEQMSEFYYTQYRASLGPKNGWFRRHVFGTSPAWSFRAVISSISENHDYDEVHLPWSLGISVLRIHILNKLFRRGFTLKQAINFITVNMLHYNKMLHDIVNEILAECGNGFPISLQRNPSLDRLSAQNLRWTKIKTDPKINTISMSTLALVGPNSSLFPPGVILVESLR